MFLHGRDNGDWDLNDPAVMFIRQVESATLEINEKGTSASLREFV